MPEAIKSHYIISFVHCRMCNEEWEMSDKSMSPREYAHIEVGINIDNQILIGCVRHNAHIAAFTLYEQVNMEALGRNCDCCE